MRIIDIKTRKVLHDDEELFDVYVVIVPANSSAFEAMAATVIQYEDAATNVTWEEAEEIQQRSYMVNHD